MVNRLRMGFVFFVVLLGLGMHLNLYGQDGNSIDLSIIETVNGWRTPMLDPVFHEFDRSIYPVAALWILEPIVFAEKPLKAAATGDAWLALSGNLLGIAMSTAINKVSKNVFKRPRPFKSSTAIEALNPLDSYSFPSGHATTSFFVATGIYMRGAPSWFAITSFAWASLVSFGRMYNGVHYLSDVSVGALMGVGMAWLHETYVSKRWFRQQEVSASLSPTQLSFSVKF